MGKGQRDVIDFLSGNILQLHRQSSADVVPFVTHAATLVKAEIDQMVQNAEEEVLVFEQGTELVAFRCIHGRRFVNGKKRREGVNIGRLAYDRSFEHATECIMDALICDTGDTSDGCMRTQTSYNTPKSKAYSKNCTILRVCHSIVRLVVKTC